MIYSSFIHSTIVHAITYPLRRVQWIQQSGISLPQQQQQELPPSSSSSIHDDQDVTLPLINILQLLSKNNSSEPSSLGGGGSELSKVYHGYMYSLLVQTYNHLTMRATRNSFLSALNTAITHPIMMGVHRMAIDISSTSQWKDEIGQVLQVRGVFGLFRGLIPQLISSHLTNRIVGKTVFGFINRIERKVDKVSNNTVFGNFAKQLLRFVGGVVLGAVSYPFLTLSIRLQTKPEASTSEIMEELTREGIVGIYGGFSTYVVCSAVSLAVRRFLEFTQTSSGSTIN